MSAELVKKLEEQREEGRKSVFEELEASVKKFFCEKAPKKIESVSYDGDVPSMFGGSEANFWLDDEEPSFVNGHESGSDAYYEIVEEETWFFESLTSLISHVPSHYWEDSYGPSIRVTFSRSGMKVRSIFDRLG